MKNTPEIARVGSVAGSAAQRPDFNQRLLTLGNWLISRANAKHNELTTRSMLRRKVDDILYLPGRSGTPDVQQETGSVGTGGDQSFPNDHGQTRSGENLSAESGEKS
jgi:hypothetical protein